jgi:hypothetical protein
VQCQRRKSAGSSYVEVRFLPWILLGSLVLAAALPLLLWATDNNGDGLDDAWEASYGITTNAYDATNLVGWWQLNGTNNTDAATDRSGNGVRGTLSNFPTVAYGPGLFSNALYFTTNATVGFPTTNSALNLANGFTYSAWFQVANTNATQASTVATWQDTGSTGWSVGTTTGGHGAITFYDGVTEQVVQGTASPVNLYDGDWHQLAATLDTNEVATLYVDGQPEATNTIAGWTPGAVGSFTFGAGGTNTDNNPFILDEARLYNRALGASEIPQLPVTYTDLNGSGLTVLDDYIEGLNPLNTNSIVSSAFAASGLSQYYGTNSPTLTKTGGDGQTISANTFGTSALVVHVADSSNNPLVNAPITFSIASGSDGLVSVSNVGPTTTSLSITTDASGNATIYYESGGDTFKTNTINATAVSESGSVSVSFTENCGVQSGMVLWLKADAGVTTDGSGNVSAWADQSPAAENAAQSTSGDEPQVVTNALNGKPVIRFNGSSAYLQMPPGFAEMSSGVSFFAVFTPTTMASWERIFDLGNGSPSDNIIFCRNSNESTFAFNTDTGGGNLVQGSSESSLNTAQEYSGILNGASSMTLYQNGAQVGQVTSGLTAPANVTRNYNYVGKSNWSGDPLYQGDMAEIIIYNRPITDIERDEVEGYLADKYGLALLKPF